MKWFFWMYSVLLCTVSAAQSSGTYTIGPGVKVLDVIPIKEVYQYPDFVTGVVEFRDGTSSSARLNYNALIAEVQFIDPKGDTLSLANEETVRHVLFPRDTFYYSEGWVRLITGNASVKLGEKIFFKEFIQKPGAYGLSSATTATNNLTAILDKRSVDLNISQEIVLEKNISYLLANKFNEFQAADKKSISRMFPRQKKGIEEYLKNNEVNFNKKEDLIRLTDFLTTIN